VRPVACDDAGRTLNPLLADGQRHRGIAQGVAQALYEQVVFDAEGNPLTATFADYAAVSAAELPSFELGDLETPTWVNRLGAKGIGQSGTIGATPAVQNAVCDALAHLGVRHVDMPCTPERVWRAICAARTSAPETGPTGLARGDSVAPVTGGVIWGAQHPREGAHRDGLAAVTGNVCALRDLSGSTRPSVVGGVVLMRRGVP
jgi:hypothetical protein